jgi:prepilin-type N-terminal cleavage/methylation domain-containing protein
MTRRGFSLIELLIAIVIFGIVSTAIYGLLTRTQRLSRTQAERSILQANMRTGLALVTSELRELNINASASDIVSMGTNSIVYRGMRGTGFICAKAAGSLTIRADAFSGVRHPQAGRDSLLIFVENDPDRATDDGWTRRNLSGVTDVTCPDGSKGIQLSFSTNLPTSPDTLAMVTLGSPVRTFEVMQIGSLTADGETWLGARSVSGGETALQPVLGPLAANGVTFAYHVGVAPTSATTSSATAVRTIRLTLRGLTENIVAAGAGTTPWQRATEELVTDIRLRNAP